MTLNRFPGTTQALRKGRATPPWLMPALLALAVAQAVTGAQGLTDMSHVVLRGRQVFVVTNDHPVLLQRELTLTPDLTVATNGVVRITGGGERQLPEGRKVSLDGFWMNDDGVLAYFKPHYTVRDGRMCYVEDGVFAPLTEAVTFNNGLTLRPDGTVVTPSRREIRLQDGHTLSANGEPLQALDHVQIRQGKLVLQKDGSLVPLPPGRTIGMSDGTKVQASGLITRRSGEQFTLAEGQRLTVEGAAMPPLK